MICAAVRPSTRLYDAGLAAGQAYQDGPKVAAVLADLESAPVEDGLRATLRMLGKLTREGKVGAEDMRQVLSAGVSPQQVEDALAVCAAFNTTGRLAGAFGFEVLSPGASRQEPSTCSSGVTGSAFSYTGGAGACMVLGGVRELVVLTGG